MKFEEINHLLELSRMEIKEEEKEKLSQDLESILSYVSKLNEIQTEEIEPMTGGSFLSNIVREDEPEKEMPEDSKTLKEMAFRIKDDYFEIPPIF